MPRLLKLTLTHFRNYERLVWEPENSLVVLTGENGSGKTNLLEAISLLTPGRGLRRAALPLLGQNGAAEWGISARISSPDGDVVDLATGVIPETDSGRRIVLLNGKTIRNRDSADNNLSAVWITPQMDRLFSENASGRRRFLDRLVMAVTPNHARQLMAYDRAMAQRNKLLQTRYSEQSWLAGLEALMARHAVAIAAARADLAQQLCTFAQNQSGHFPIANIRLECSITRELENHPALWVEDWLKEQFALSRPVDKERGRSTIGTHKSDFALSDFTTGQSASIASTGQQKSMLLGLILAHARLVTDHRGTPPILLLDEPLVHLDEARRTAFLETVRTFDTSVILTGTDATPFEFLRNNAQFIRLKNGDFLR